MNHNREGRWSWWMFILLSAFILIFRFTHQYQHELAWDIFGYYLPLPATFVYDDALMSDRSWVEAINQQYHLTDTIYQISSTPDGEPMYFFFLGMSLLLLPFFLLGHGGAYLFGYPMDGFSLPYEEALVFGATLYTLLGLWYFRKWLLLFLKDSTVALMMVLLVFATNYFAHGILKNLETVSFLFTGAAMVLYYSYQVHTVFKRRHLILLCIVLTLVVLIKPSEGVFALIPLLHGVFNKDLRRAKSKLLSERKKEIFQAFFIGVLIVGVQITYFLIKTGRPIYDSYINPGVGLDFAHPHFFEAMFGFRKGWLIYTPLMVLFFIGLPLFYQRFRSLFWSWMIPFLLGFYIVISWSEYWYGAAFSIRPLMAWYPLLFLVIGILWEKVGTPLVAKWSLGVFFVACSFLNVFQFWQLENGILDPYRTTKDYYWAIFLKTKVPKQAERLKLVGRSFDGEAQIQFPDKYRLKNWPLPFHSHFETKELYANNSFVPVNQLTDEDHVFLEISGDFHSDSNQTVHLGMMIMGANGTYGFKYVDLTNGHFEILYLTPELRRRTDQLQFYFLNPNEISYSVENLKVKLKVPK